MANDIFEPNARAVVPPRVAPVWLPLAAAQLDALPPKRSSNGRMRDVEAGSDPRQRAAGGVEAGGFTHLFVREALAAECDAALTQQCGNSRFGDAVAIRDVLRGDARLVLVRNVGNIVG